MRLVVGQVFACGDSQSRRDYRKTTFPVAIVAGSHLFPFRTEKLSPPTPMVLQCNAGE